MVVHEQRRGDAINNSVIYQKQRIRSCAVIGEESCIGLAEGGREHRRHHDSDHFFQVLLIFLPV